MPQTYAHQHYGDLVYAQLPEEIRKVIDDHRDLYDIGLQGPDILFYYHPLWKNPVSQLGGDMHEWSGRRWFSRAAKALTGIDPLVDTAEPGSEEAAQENPYSSLSFEEQTSDDACAALAYVYGSLCHFALDSICHAYINRYDEVTEGVTHSAIEGDFDRYLIAQEGRDPVQEDMTGRFLPSREAAHVIARFYPEVPEATLYAALRSFVSFHHLLYCPGDGKRNFLYAGMHVLGIDSLRGHITPPAPDPLCKESTAHLAALLQEGVPVGAGLIAGFTQNLRYDNQYRLNYEGVPVDDNAEGGQ